MHRALIVSSKYDPATGYPDREAWRVSNKRLGLRLQQHGYAVEWLEPGAGLVRKLREALATEDPLSAVVMVFSGYVLLTESGDPALLLSDEQVIALRLEQLCSKASRTFGRVLLVLDGVRGSSTRIVHEANPEARQINAETSLAREPSAETLLARMAVRTIRSDNTGMLVRVAPWGAPDTLPDSGLCEQLSLILENLDDAQALATPELELDLLDSDADDGSAVLCRHSKPAFVFLPARRFASEPPKAPGVPAPQLDDGVDPYTSRDASDDRDAWTPPPDGVTPSPAVPIYSRPSQVGDDPVQQPAAHDEDAASEPDSAPTLSSETRDVPAASVSASTEPTGPAAPSSLAALPPLAAAASALPPLNVPPPLATPPLAAPSAVPPIAATPLPSALPPLNVPPPLAVPSAPPLAAPTLAAPAALPPLVAPSAAPPAVATTACATPSQRPLTLGTPPPLPSERAAELGQPSEPAPGRSAQARRPNELGTPPPLPSERATAASPATPAAEAPSAAPVAASASPPLGALPPLPLLGGALPPALPGYVSPPLGSTPPLGSAGPSVAPPPVFVPPKDLGLPPPLPFERAVAAHADAGSPSAAPSAATDAPAVASGETDQAAPTATSAGDATAPSASDQPAPSPNGPELTAPTTWRTSSTGGAGDTTATSDVGEPAADPSESRPSQSPSRPGPPPRKPRDSGAPDVPAAAGAPSLPPPVVSPESWRPQPPGATAPRDEAALLERAQTHLSANQLEQALSHAKACLASFPESARALQIAGSVLVSQGDFAALAALYDELIGRLEATPAAQLCAAASRLWQTQLHDPLKARELLERGLQLDANNPSLQRELADLLDASGAPQEALAHSLAALRANPFSPAAAQSTFQRLLGTHASELEFTVACLLSFLGHPSNRVVDLLASHRSATLPRPTRSLNEDDYQFGLDASDSDPELTRVLMLLEPYARKLEMPKPKQQRQLLDSLRAEDVERSTTMLARTFGWTCRLLTLGSPALYLSEADSLPQLLPIEGANFVVGKSLGRGLSVAELAFLWGRALSWSRPQTRILYTLPTTVKLGQLLRATRVAAGLEEASGAETKTLSKALRKEILGQTWDVLVPALVALGPDFEARVEGWKHAADRTANRLGLLASGDPELAARTLDRFPTTDGGSRRLQLSELFSFALSEPYRELRQRLGLHLG